VSKGQERPADLNKQLLELVHETIQAADLEAVLAAVLQGARNLVPSDGAAVMWRDEDRIKVLASSGPTAALPGLTLPSSQMGATRPVMDGCRPVLIADTAEDARWQRVPGEGRVRSWLGVPLLVGNRAAGVMEWTARLPSRFTTEDLATATQLARHVAPILDRVQLLDDMRQRLRHLVEPLNPASAQVAEPGPGLQEVAHEAREFTSARHAFVFLLDAEAGHLRCAAASGDQRERLRYATIHGDGTLGSWAIPLARSQGWLGSRVSDRETMSSLGIEDALVLPLRVRGKPVGMLGVAERLDGDAFDQDALRIMTQLASQASMILEQSYRARPEPASFNYEKVVQSSPLAVGVLTLAGEIRTCNPGLAELLSRSSRSLAGQALSEFLIPSDGRRLVHAMEEVVVTGQRRQVDVRLRTELGEQRHVRVSLALARVANDASDDLVAILEDITPLKILEQERVEHLRELRDQHSQLRELDRLKSRFVSNVSHELRTPLAVIKLYATLARKGRPEKQSHYLQTIEQETHRLETMVENVLDLSRLDRDAIQVHPEELATEEIIAEVLRIYQETASSKSIELVNQVQGQLPGLWSDRGHLIQMLTNLVDNALKYTPRGGSVWVAAREVVSNSEPRLEITVRDNGTGIPEDEQDKVFERFYRGSNNITATTGTGLGLAIVQELLAQHGGRLSLESQVGRGSVFTLQFPLRRRAIAPLRSSE